MVVVYPDLEHYYALEDDGPIFPIAQECIMNDVFHDFYESKKRKLKHYLKHQIKQMRWTDLLKYKNGEIRRGVVEIFLYGMNSSNVSVFIDFSHTSMGNVAKIEKYIYYDDTLHKLNCDKQFKKISELADALTNNNE